MNLNTLHFSSWDEDDWPAKDDGLAEMCEDIASYSADFSRSNEEGWFYSDRETGIDSIPDRADDDH